MITDRLQQSIAVIVREGLVGKALEKLVRLLTPERASVLRAAASAPKTIVAFVGEHGPAVLFLDILDISSRSAPHQGTIPTVVYLRSDQAAVEVCDALLRVTCLNQTELREAIRAWSKEFRGLRHEIQNLRDDMRRNEPSMPPADFIRKLEKCSADLEALGFSDEARDVQKVMGSMTSGVSLAAAANRLTNLDWIGTGSECQSVPPCPEETRAQGRAPNGYETVLVADDQAILLREWAAVLEDLGYSVDLEDSFPRSQEILVSNPPEVFVCDLNWGSRPGLGIELIRLAIQQRENDESCCRLIAIISADRMDANAVPTGVELVDSPDAKAAGGARQLHRLICARAKT
jgi:CheY-like chemotaxis protein